jgi:hypothetical protein
MSGRYVKNGLAGGDGVSAAGASGRCITCTGEDNKFHDWTIAALQPFNGRGEYRSR